MYLYYNEGIYNRTDKSNIPIYIAMAIPIFTGINGNIQMIVSIIELIILLYYFNSDKFWALTPIYYIYYSQLLIVGDRVALFSIYSIICVFRVFYRDRYIKRRDLNLNIVVMMILSLYASGVIMFHSGLWSGFMLAIQSIAMCYAAVCIRKNEIIHRTFKVNLILMCLSGTLYGIIFENIKGGYKAQTTLIQYGGRYSGTTSDPNYMSFYYCIAFSLLLFLRTDKTWIKRAGLFLLFLSIALTGSLTALGTIAIVLIFYIFIGEEYARKTKMLNFFLVIAGIVFFIFFITNNSLDIPVLNLYRMRLNERIEFIKIGNYSGATSGRTEYSKQYISYLFNQNIFRVLFGGYQLNAAALMGEAYETIKFAAHNTYVDVLMTNGIVGVGLFVVLILCRLVTHIKKWRLYHNAEEIGNAIYMLMITVFMYGLSMYPSSAYMIFLLI